MPPDMGVQPGPSRDKERDKTDKKDENAPERSTSSSGRKRLGNYTMHEEIGRGSFATVYKGYRTVSTLIPTQF
jgi:hypothetical protein